MIGPTISTIAFDTDLVIKNIHNHSTLYIVHDKRNGIHFFYRDNSRLLCVKNTEQHFIHNSKTYENARNISADIQ